MPCHRPQTGGARHLLYHVYPKRGSNWHWNLDKLRRRMSLFNGRRVVGVAVGPETEPASAVEGMLSGCGCEFIEAANDPGRREGTTFVQLHERVERFASPADVIFYGHAKGITSEKWAAGVRRWTEALYETCLDRWPAVRRLLVDYPTAGPFLRLGNCFPEYPPSDWHFSGSWRWTRSADLFSRDWRTVPAVWIGVEAHPSIVFRRDEAGCIVHPFSENGLALYTEQHWRTQAGPALEAWREETLADRWQPLLLTCVLVSHQKPRRIHEAIRSVLAQTSPDWQLVIIDSGSLVDELRPYESDARVRVIESPDGPRCQGWQINECARRGLVQGDLVCYLSDDDVYAPGAFAAFLGAARAAPWESAWWGPADRVEVRESGERPMGLLTAAPGERLNGRIDGIQVCHRTALRRAWPEDEAPEVRAHADGLFLDRLQAATTVTPIAAVVGRHRHTPESEFTRPS